MTDLLYREESFKIVGLCMDAHRELGRGYSEAVYKDALEFELTRSGIPFAREKEYTIKYKSIVLPHKYFADFVIWDRILLEAKAVDSMLDVHVKQVLNYLAASKLKLGLLVNFGEASLAYKRVVL